MNGITSLGGALLYLAACVFTSNPVFTRFLGTAPYAGPGDVGKSAKLGLYVTSAMTLSSLLAWPVHQLLAQLSLGYLDAICFLLLAAGVVALLRLAVKSISPAGYAAMEGAWTLILVDSALLGVTLLNVWAQYDFLKSVLSGLFGGLGFTLAAVLLAGVRERLATSKIPASLKGLPITLISAGLISLAFLGFMGMAK